LGGEGKSLRGEGFDRSLNEHARRRPLVPFSASASPSLATTRRENIGDEHQPKKTIQKKQLDNPDKIKNKKKKNK
jgi:hypothetical protein